MSTPAPPNQGIASILAQGIMAAYANDASQLPPGFQANSAPFYVAEWSVWNGAYVAVPFGFVATNGSMNIVVMRGTANAYEAEINITSWGVNTPCILPPNGNFGTVQAGLYQLYTQNGNGVVSLSTSMRKAVSMLGKPTLPLYVAGHSLGGPMSTFGALDIFANAPAYKSKMQLYTMASLHVGLQDFATAYNKTGIPTYRFANLSDFVPSLTGVTADSTGYVHVGLPCTFVWQTWLDWGNHSMANIYQPTIDKHWSVIQYGDLKYPASVKQ